MSKNGAARPSPGPTVKVSRLPEQPSGLLLRRKVASSRPALQRSWSTIGWRISRAWSKSYAKKAATFSRRSTIPSTGSLAGSSIQKETRQNFGNRLRANNAYEADLRGAARLDIFNDARLEPRQAQPLPRAH